MTMRVTTTMARLVRTVLAVGLMAFTGTAGAATIWNGPSITFSKSSAGDPTQAANQDRITPLVWITRGATMGLFNAFAESSYSPSSPVGTEWAYGTTANL